MNNTPTHLRTIAVRIIIVLVFVLSALSTMVTAQNTNLQNINGNATSNGNFIGTTNNEPLVFKTNGSEATRIKPNGEVKFTTFENIGKGVVTFNNNGVLTTRIFPNDTNQVFCGSGNFKSVAALSGWTRTGNVLYNAPSVNVGIGTNNPQYALDVVGSANFTGTISAQGVILTNKLLADTMQAGSMFALNNRLHMNAGGTNEIYTSMGDLRLQCNVSNPTNTIFSAGTSGNVGIGTFTPQAKLDVEGSLRVNGTITAPQFANQGYGFLGIGPGGEFLFFPDPSLDPVNPNLCNPGAYDWNLNGNLNTDPQTDFIGTCDGSDFVFRTSSTERMRLTGDGKFGVGTNSPAFQLQVNVDQTVNAGAPAAAFAATGASASSIMLFIPNSIQTGYNPVVQQGDCGIFWSDGLAQDGKNQNSSFVIAPWSDATNSAIRIEKDGNVGIGVADPAYKLDVGGLIRAKEVRIEITGCDFVFDSSYYLMPLDSVNSFIAQNRRLPGIQSAAEMETPNGVAIGELNSQYLMKIEELTLYIIELNSRIEALEKKGTE